MIGKVGAAYRYFFSVRTGSGAARTGLVTANFTITVRNPGNTATLAAPTVTEVGAGQYFFDIAGAFSTTHGAGQYGVTLSVILAPLDTVGGSVDFFVSSLDDLATATALAAVQSDTDDIQTRLPASLTGGRMRSHVEALDAGVITAVVAPNLDVAVSTRSDFNEVTDPVELLDAGGAAGTSAAELVADIDVALSAAHGAGSWATSTLGAAAVATAVWSEILPGAFGAGTAGLILGTNLDVVLSTRAAPGDAMALTIAERTATATEVDAVLSLAHGAGSWVGAGLTVTQDDRLRTVWKILGLDPLQPTTHTTATIAVDGSISTPDTEIDITVDQVDANTATFTQA